MNFILYGCGIVLCISLTKGQNVRKTSDFECTATEWFRCMFSPCFIERCYAYPEAVCSVETKLCGGCRAVWTVGGKEVNCKKPRCPAGVHEMNCPNTLCQDPFCPDFPNATCRPDVCGHCGEDYFLNGLKVDCVGSFRQQLRMLRQQIRGTSPSFNNGRPVSNIDTSPIQPIPRPGPMPVGSINELVPIMETSVSNGPVQSTINNSPSTNNFAEFGINENIPLSGIVDISGTNPNNAELQQNEVVGNLNDLTRLNSGSSVGSATVDSAATLIQDNSRSIISQLNQPLPNIAVDVIPQELATVSPVISPEQSSPLSRSDLQLEGRPSVQTEPAASNPFEIFGFAGTSQNQDSLSLPQETPGTNGVIDIPVDVSQKSNNNPSEIATGGSAQAITDQPTPISTGSPLVSDTVVDPVHDPIPQTDSSSGSGQSIDPFAAFGFSVGNPDAQASNTAPSHRSGLPNELQQSPIQPNESPNNFALQVESIVPVSSTTSIPLPSQSNSEVPQSSNIPLQPNAGVPFQVASCIEGYSRPNCSESACAGQTCSVPGARCYESNCGSCHAEWYLDGRLVDCSADCPANTVTTVCTNPCSYMSCPAHTNAVCRESKCGACTTEYFVNNERVNCDIQSDACPPGQEPKGCVCFAKICPYDSQARCRVIGCGTQCQIEYYKIGQNGFETVSCGWFNRKRN